MRETTKPAETSGVTQATQTNDGSGSPTTGAKEALRGMDYDAQVAALAPVQASTASGAPVQMQGGDDKITWVPGIDIGKASSYDAGGGHSYKDHGAHTTKEQHMTRLRTGIAPSGRASAVPPSAPGSSKFDSDGLHESALKAAETQLIEKNKNKTRKRGINGKIGVSGAGTIFTRDNKEETATDVHVDVHVVDGKFNINTAFPTK